MIDINTYRSRIGLFCSKPRKNKFLLRSDYYKQCSGNTNQWGENILSVLQFIFKLVLLLGLLHQTESESCQLRESLACPVGLHSTAAMVHSGTIGVYGGSQVAQSVVWSVWKWGSRGAGEYLIWGENHTKISKIVNHNFLARYLNGNIQKKKRYP